MIYVTILFLAFAQNVAFTMVSRSRNRDHMTYHAICAVFSNLLWFLTIKELVAADLSLVMAVPYVVGTVCGSLFGAKISMFIEKVLNARADPI